MTSGSTILMYKLLITLISNAERQLRHKLEAGPSRPRLLATEPGIGYRLRV